MLRKTPGAAAGAPPVLDLLTVAEVAAFTKVSEQTVRRWLAEGRITHQYVGRQIRIYRHDVEAFFRVKVFT